MTATMAPPFAGRSTGPAVGWIGRPRLLLGADDVPLGDHRAHVAAHGPLPPVDRRRLLAEVEAVDLRGRGGAGFPLAAKLRALRVGEDVEVVINGCEGEPASAKDTVLLTRAPHLALDGAALVADGLGARRVIVAVTEPALAAGLGRAIGTRPDARRFEVRLVADAFVTGEARALAAALSEPPAAAPVPPGRRVPPSERGVDGRPTLLSNAETFAQVAILVRLGRLGYAEVGTPAESGTALLTVTGAVRRPGVLEVPFGTGLAAVAEAAGACASQAVVIGGFHGSWLPADASVRLSRAGLADVGASLGAGAVMFVGQDSCALAELARIGQWLADASTKRCGPCAFGLPALVDDVRSLALGRPDTGAADRHLAAVTGRGACAHPDGAVRFIGSALAVSRPDLDAHRRHGGCGRPDRGYLRADRSVLTAAVVPSTAPTGRRPR